MQQIWVKEQRIEFGFQILYSDVDLKKWKNSNETMEWSSYTNVCVCVCQIKSVIKLLILTLLKEKNKRIQ